jgi:hypothetical protein
LRRYLPTHSVATVYEKGWSTLANGELLLAAEQEEFEILVTTDQNIKHQQNLVKYRLAIVVLTTTSWPIIQQHLSDVSAAIDKATPGCVVEVDF